MELCLYVVGVFELCESPSAVFAEVVYAGYPVSFDGVFFGFGVFSSVAFDFNYEV